MEEFGHLYPDHSANPFLSPFKSPWRWEGAEDKPVLVPEYDLDCMRIECKVGDRCLLGPYAMRRLPYDDPRPLVLFIREDRFYLTWLCILRFRAWWVKTKIRLIKTAILWGLAAWRVDGPYVRAYWSDLKWWFQS